MDLENFIKLLKKIDFKKNSVLEISKKINVNEKTIRKYLNLHNIPYNKKSIINTNRKRNEFGQYTINFNTEQFNNILIKTNKNIKSNQNNSSINLSKIDPYKIWNNKK